MDGLELPALTTGLITRSGYFADRFVVVVFDFGRGCGVSGALRDGGMPALALASVQQGDLPVLGEGGVGGGGISHGNDAY